MQQGDRGPTRQPSHDGGFGRSSTITSDGELLATAGAVAGDGVGGSTREEPGCGASAPLPSLSPHASRSLSLCQALGESGGGDSALLPQRQLSVMVPSVEGELDSWQFEVLMDVMQNIMARPLPTVRMFVSSTSIADGVHVRI